MVTPKKTIKVKVKHNFYDRTDSLKLKKAGEELTVSTERADKLISPGPAEKPDAGAEEATAEKQPLFYLTGNFNKLYKQLFVNRS